jgi:crotonobetainyl-CoA:carnitine CoA-transferase CaiB-like acyl-CoA transferase
MTIAGGIAAALFHRERTGQATTVDDSLLSTAMWAAGATLLGAGVNGSYTRTMPSRYEIPNPVVNVYRTGDGRFITLVFLQSDRYWGEFVVAAGRPDLEADDRFSSAKARYENRRACVEELEALFASKTLEQWRADLADIEGAWAPVLQPNEVLADPQVRPNDYLREFSLEDGTTFEIVAAPIQFDERPPDLRRAPDHGEPPTRC